MPGRMVLAGAVAGGLAVANLVLVGAPGARATFPGANGKVVFQSRPNVSGTTYDIFTVNPDRTGLTNLTNNPAQDEAPEWSPDASKIAFKSNRDGNDDIYVMHADGSGVTRLTEDPSRETQPAWSPDGTQIVFMRFLNLRWGNRIVFESQRCPPPCPASDIYVVKANGTGLVQLTDNFGNNLFPGWSPDGDKVVFAHSPTTPPRPTPTTST